MSSPDGVRPSATKPVTPLPASSLHFSSFTGLGPALKQQLEAIYLSHRQALFSLALSTTGCAAMAEDAVHEAFVRLCRLSPTSPSEQLVAYVFAAVRNAAIDAGRRLQSQKKLAESIFQMRGSKSTEGVSENDDQTEMLRTAVEALEQPAREVVILKVYGALTFEQIGQVLEIPAATAATRYRRALTHIEDALRNRT